VSLKVSTQEHLVNLFTQLNLLFVSHDLSCSTMLIWTIWIVGWTMRRIRSKFSGWSSMGWMLMCVKVFVLVLWLPGCCAKSAEIPNDSLQGHSLCGREKKNKKRQTDQRRIV
jgi:hypothetical protein